MSIICKNKEDIYQARYNPIENGPMKNKEIFKKSKLLINIWTVNTK